MKNIPFYKDGKSNYVIVQPSSPDQIHQDAVKLLNDEIYKACSITLPVITDNESPQYHEIIIGNCPNRNTVFGSTILLDHDEFYLFNKDSKIYINGNRRGLMLGVSYFLENYLKVKKLMVTGRNGAQPIECFKVKSLPEVYITKFNFNIQKPAFSYRWVVSQEAYSKNYSNFNKLSYWDIKVMQPAALEDSGESVHNLTRLFGYQTHFASHPEYYPYINGSRTSELMTETQCHRAPCLSQAGVFDIVKAALQAKMDEKPDKPIWNLSQPDGMTDYCQCSECAPKHALPGGFSNTLFPFINRMAKEFPDKIIKTLSYVVSDHIHTVETVYSNGNILPAGKVEPNVMIIYCPTINNKIKSIASSNELIAGTYREMLYKWSQSGGKLFIWEYLVNFSYYLFPFPTLHILQENLKYYKSLGVSSFFAECSSTEDSALRSLNTYAYARLLWNPDDDLEGIISDFCKNYYGTGYKEMFQYITTLLKYANNDNSGVWNSMGGTGSMIGHANPVLSVEGTTLFSIKHLKEFYQYIDDALAKVNINSNEWAAIKREQICLKQVEVEASCTYAHRLSTNQDFFDYFTRYGGGNYGNTPKGKIQNRCYDLQTDCLSLNPPIENINGTGRKITPYVTDVINGAGYN
ncbi:hypothetical protein OK18_11435 [Chryseobacterium gallinarum]|uniref:DUF4838 domain-containing protein n=1 Tax=Chryseobacterium gallinarum TaxID=1324352 RepID=A0A0G3M1V8_CHRGL|nr:DUF4838 domain-containing protein [Chryseobacterium gallinarum]AKK73146.1 hypothetical protein OK18_11435 [Chryseobacterium gallinarum]